MIFRCILCGIEQRYCLLPFDSGKERLHSGGGCQLPPVLLFELRPAGFRALVIPLPQGSGGSHFFHPEIEILLFGAARPESVYEHPDAVGGFRRFVNALDFEGH